ncbi:SIS domain-containing protein [Streptomyces fuscigenes]|uniref:SIS domain-containing protein n=1 Tax=Streptomyces fuscigenes TaxID=1528880 RepID=UPI001F3BAC95|nr:SIS domain-containing protein [Streptomyces fuscigenes]MCF3961791.1 mannose-6-phosphate isomerase [Streptomyces fuscigenes]
MLDESMLDAPDDLARADRRGLLRGAAEAGARVRTALRNTEEAGVTALSPEGRPRSVMVAGSGAAATAVADLVDSLAGAIAPVTHLRPTGVAPVAGALHWSLPGWTGAVDLLLIVTTDGGEPGLGVLAEQAYRRGCTVVAVAPRRSPLTETVDGARGLLVPLAANPPGRYESPYAAPWRDEPGSGPEPGIAPRSERGTAPGARPGTAAESGFGPESVAAGPGALWGLFTPLLVLLDRIGLITAPNDVLERLADRLDRVAERCGPAVATYDNPAKTLAVELAESLPLIWTEGGAAPVGRRFASALTELAGRPALAAELPEALEAHGALLRAPSGGGGDLDDFFRDRVEDAETLRPRVVLLRDRPAEGLTAAPTARETADAGNTPLSELEPEEGNALEALAELVAVTDFTAAYLALAAPEG